MNLSDIRFSQYAGLWALAETHIEVTRAEFETQLAALRNLSPGDLSAALEARTSDMKSNANVGFQLTSDGIAVLRLEGTMTKYGSSLSSAGSMLRMESAIRNARKSTDVKGAIAVIDTPGGSIHGLESLAAEWAAFAKDKPATTLIENMGCSAGYWFASQSQTLAALPGSIVGSIGVFQAVADYSAQAAQDGVKVHVIRSGEFKGAGVPGTEITAKQLAEWQRGCDAVYDSFLKAISATGRMSLEEARTLADGRVHSAEQAVPLKLIDQVATFDQVYEALVAKVNHTSPAKSAGKPKDTKMAAASFKEIVTACKGCNPSASGDDAKFVADCQQKELELAACQTAWMDTLAARASERETEAAQLRDQLKAREQGAKGQSAIPTGRTVSEPISNGTGTATEQWMALVNAIPAGADKQAAMGRIIQDNKAIYKAYLAEFNAAHPHHRGDE